MARLRNHYDPNQAEFGFSEMIEIHCNASEAIRERISDSPTDQKPEHTWESEEEITLRIAAACKRAIRESGLSREQVLDRINELYGRTGKDDHKKPLSLPMFNHYLSKPHEYEMKPWLIIGICRVTDSIYPLEPFISPIGACIVSAEETTELMLGKIEASMREHRRLKTELTKQLAARQAG